MQFIQGSGDGLSVGVSFLCLLIGLFLGLLTAHIYIKLKRNFSHQTSTTLIASGDKGKPLNSFLSHRLRAVIRNIINSQYVLHDKQSYGSIFQTPLRDNINELRDIANALTAVSTPQHYNADAVGHIESASSTNSTPVFIVADVLAQVEGTFAELCESRDVKFSSVYDLPEQTLYCTDWLFRIVHELLLNALNSSKTPQKLQYNVSKKGSDLLLNVIDNGKGISAAIMQMINQAQTPRLFYRRAEDTQLETNLFMITQYLHSVGGNIEVKSALGFGTHVMVRLPLSISNAKNSFSENTPQSQHAVSTVKAKRHSVYKTLLVVDKPFGYLHTKAEHLHADYIVKTVHSVDEAIRVMKNTHIHCALVDAEFNVYEGMCLKDYLVSIVGAAELPFITLGHQDFNMSQVRLLRSGISTFIEKPITPEAIKLIIEKVISDHEQVQYKLENAIAQYHSNLLDTSVINNIELEFKQSFTQVLETHYANEALTRPKAASLLCMTEKTLARRLNKHYQSGFCEILKRFRLHKAKDRIVQGERITVVAYDCGFSSPSYFTQCFRTEYGFAPSMLNKLKSA